MDVFRVFLRFYGGCEAILGMIEHSFDITENFFGMGLLVRLISYRES